MTSEEIRQKPAINLSTDGWLREACLQLALLNEKSDLSWPETPPPYVHSGGPTIGELARVKRTYNRRSNP